MSEAYANLLKDSRLQVPYLTGDQSGWDTKKKVNEWEQTKTGLVSK